MKKIEKIVKTSKKDFTNLKFML